MYNNMSSELFGGPNEMTDSDDDDSLDFEEGGESSWFDADGMPSQPQPPPPPSTNPNEMTGLVSDDEDPPPASTGDPPTSPPTVETPVKLTLDYHDEYAELLPNEISITVELGTGGREEIAAGEAGVLVGLNDQFRQVNGYDCCKDALQCNGTKVAVEAKFVLNELIKCIVGDCPNHGGSWPNSWHANLNGLFKGIKGETHAQSVEKVLERKTGCILDVDVEKLLYVIYLTECGVGPERIAAVIDSIIKANNCAQHKDDGPGGGQDEREFPKVGSTIVITKNFYELLGFKFCPMELTAVTMGLNQYSYVMNTGLKEYFEMMSGAPESGVVMSETFSRLLAEKTIIREDSGIADSKARTNNNWKNGLINSLAASLQSVGIVDGRRMVEHIITCDDEYLINLFLDSLIGVLTKLLGDGDQSFLHFMLHNVLKNDGMGKFCISQDFIDAISSARGTLGRGGGAVQSGGAWEGGMGDYIGKYTTMLTCDKTVFHRSVALYDPIVLTNGGGGLSTGLEYTPQKLPIEEVLNSLLNSEVDLIRKSFQKIKANIWKIRSDGIFYQVIGRGGIRFRQYRRSTPLEIKLAEIIELLDTFDNEVSHIATILKQLIDGGSIIDVNGFIQAIDGGGVIISGNRFFLRKYLLPEIITPLPNGQRGYITVTLDQSKVPLRFVRVNEELKILVNGMAGGGPNLTKQKSTLGRPRRTRKILLQGAPAGKRGSMVEIRRRKPIGRTKTNVKVQAIRRRKPIGRTKTNDKVETAKQWLARQWRSAKIAFNGIRSQLASTSAEHASALADAALISRSVRARENHLEAIFAKLNLVPLLDLDLNEKYLIYLIKLNLKIPKFDENNAIMVNILYNHSIYYLEKYRNVEFTGIPEYVVFEDEPVQVGGEVEDEGYSYLRCQRAVFNALSDFGFTGTEISFPDSSLNALEFVKVAERVESSIVKAYDWEMMKLGSSVLFDDRIVRPVSVDDRWERVKAEVLAHAEGGAVDAVLESFIRDLNPGGHDRELFFVRKSSIRNLKPGEQTVRRGLVEGTVVFVEQNIRDGSGEMTRSIRLVPGVRDDDTGKIYLFDPDQMVLLLPPMSLPEAKKKEIRENINREFDADPGYSSGVQLYDSIYDWLEMLTPVRSGDSDLGGGAPKCMPYSTNEFYKPPKKKSLRKKKTKKKIIKKKSPKYSKRKSIKKKTFKKSKRKSIKKKSKRKN
jgi:hypothetical protein